MLARMVTLSLLGLGGLARASEPVLIPEFSPQVADDYAISIILHEQVAERLRSDRHLVLTPDVLAAVLDPGALANCSTQESCPAEPLSRLPARVAVVVRVDRTGDLLTGHLEVWDRGSRLATDVRDIPISPGNEHLFANEVAFAVSDAFRRVGSATETERLTASQILAGQVVVLPQAQPAGPSPAPRPGTAPAPGSSPPPAPSGAATTLEDQLAGTGVKPRHLEGGEDGYRRSGLDPRDWVYHAMPHAGRVIVEVTAGLGIGDVDRGADLRVELDGGTETAQWYQEYPAVARRARGSLYLGYAPTTFLDVGLWGGVQYGRRLFTTGTTRLRTNGPVHSVGDPDDVSAVVLLLQPRLRAYVVHLGPVKPFVFTGMELKIFDGYSINQPADYSFLLPPGGVVPGWVGGGGLMLDPSPLVGFFFEVSYTKHFGPRSELYSEGTWQHEIPPVEPTFAQTVGIVGGVQFRI